MGGRRERARELDVPRFRQPDDFTCGPTCLRKIYSFWGLDLPFDAIVRETPQNEDGGTLGAFLGVAALRRGFRAAIHSYNLRVLDPTWADLGRKALSGRLQARRDAMRSGKRRRAIDAYLRFLDLGGEIRFGSLDRRTLAGMIDRGHPAIIGLSSTWLHGVARERPDDMAPDDVRGEPTGHFVVLSGYRHGGRTFSIRDPAETFGRGDRKFWIDAERLIHSILLGVLTYDGVVLEVWRE